MGMEFRKYPYTATEVVDIIKPILSEEVMKRLDYLRPEKDVVLDSYEYCLESSLNYGGSEGIYLDIYYVNCSDRRNRQEILCAKTLDEDAEAMKNMAQLLAEFTVAFDELVRKNLEDFTWTGASVFPVDANNERMKGLCAYETSDTSEAHIAELVNKLFSQGAEKVLVCNNERPKRTTIYNERIDSFEY